MDKNKLRIILRLILGGIFIVFGLNGFFHFLSMPAMPPQAMNFIVVLASTPYFFPLLKATEVICGILLVGGRFVPLSLVILAPIVLHIFLFHAFLAPDGLGLAALILGLELILAWLYRGTFRPLLKAEID